MNVVEAPQFEDLGTGDFTEFAAQATDYLRQVDPVEVLTRLSQSDLANGRMHPSGFLVIQHPSSPADRTRGQLRIHLWPSGIDRRDTDPHQHPWHIAAKVLTGEYIEQIVEVSNLEKSEQANYCQYRSTHNPSNVDEVWLQPQGPVRAEFSEIQRYASGDIHSLPNTKYHFTPVDNKKMLVTLALMGPTVQAANNLKKTSQQVGSIEPPRQKATNLDHIWLQLQQSISDTI